MDDETKLIESAINALGDGLRILGTGCGRRWLLNHSVKYHLVGIDPDEQALHIRLDSRGDLDEYPDCPVNDAEFPSHSLDVIYRIYLLEQGVGVEAAFERFTK